MFLQLYHSPFFGDESNKPILLPNEVGMPSFPCRGPLEPGVGTVGCQLWVWWPQPRLAEGYSLSYLWQPLVIYLGGESPPLGRHLAEAGGRG